MYVSLFVHFVLCIAISVAIPFSMQVHIALIPPDQVSISWVTSEPYSNKNQPVVYLSQNANITINSTKINGYTQSNVNLSRYYHHAITPSLTPLTQYWYQPGDNASVYTFIARNTLNNETTNSDEPLIKFLIYGDMGIDHSNDTIALINYLTNSHSPIPSTSIDFILHVGDIAYADDRDLFGSNPDYIPIYDTWGTLMEPIFSTTPYMTGPGNHEQTCHSWSDFDCKNDLKNFTIYREYFRMPSSKYNEIGGGPDNMWWSMDYKNIHILHLSTETDYPGSPDQADYHNDFINPEAGPFGDQMKFVENDLANAYNNENISWIIAMGHRAIYTTEFYDDEHIDWPPQTEFFMKRAFEPLFYKYNVDLYINGHIHGYERDYAIYNDQITTKNYSNPLSTIYITSGAAGSIEGHSSTVPQDKIKNYTAVYDHNNWGIGQCSIMNDTHLLWEFIASENGSVIDSVVITKGHWTN